MPMNHHMRATTEVIEAKGKLHEFLRYYFTIRAQSSD